MGPMMNVLLLRWPGWSKTRSLRALCCACLCLSLGEAAAAPLPTEEAAYSYQATNTPVTKVLEDFCKNFGWRLQANRVSGDINGRIAGQNASDFLEHLGRAIGFNWFYYAGTLYVAPVADWQMRSIPAAGTALPGLKQALNELGVLEPRFGWTVMPEQGLLLVAGPQAYIDLIARTVQALRIEPDSQQIAVFPLRYASAEDRSITVRDRQVMIPGVVSILRGLLGRSSASGAGGRAAMKPEGATDAQDAKAAEPSAAAQIAAQAGANASVQADTRLNAVIVKDRKEAIGMYQRFIDALDVPAGLVEIEATTIDVSQSRLDELGIDWSATGGRAILSYGDPSTAAAAGTLGFQTILGNQAVALLAKIRALETSGEARVIGKPSVLTTDNMSALIDLSQTYYVRVTGERVANLNSVTTGVMLKVTPHLIPHASKPTEIGLAIDIEDGALVDRSGVDLPVVQRSVISTQANIHENQSLLIGGYDVLSDQQEIEQVHGLSKLPVLGALFRTSRKEQIRRRRMFLITPRIVAQANQSMLGATERTPLPVLAMPFEAQCNRMSSEPCPSEVIVLKLKFSSWSDAVTNPSRRRAGFVS